LLRRRQDANDVVNSRHLAGDPGHLKGLKNVADPLVRNRRGLPRRRPRGLPALLVLLEVGLPRRLLVLLEVGVGFMPARRPRLTALRVLRGPRGGTDPRPGRAIGE